MRTRRVILNLPDNLAEKMDEEWRRLGLPSRNSYVEQCIRHQLKLPNVFNKEAEN